MLEQTQLRIVIRSGGCTTNLDNNPRGRSRQKVHRRKLFIGYHHNFHAMAHGVINTKATEYVALSQSLSGADRFRRDVASTELLV